MVANDVFSGEMELDFPGALTLALALPTLWAVAKSVNRIREGRRPTPVQREDKTFWEVRCVVVGLASVALSQLVETTDALLSRPARTHARTHADRLVRTGEAAPSGGAPPGAQSAD